MNYYNRFVSHFVHLAAPLSDLLQSRKVWSWTSACDSAFAALKEALCTAPCLAFPDLLQEFVLETDASDQALGAVLE